MCIYIYIYTHTHFRSCPPNLIEIVKVPPYKVVGSWRLDLGLGEVSSELGMHWIREDSTFSVS